MPELAYTPLRERLQDRLGPNRTFTDPPRRPVASSTPLPAGANAPGQEPFQAFYNTPLYQFPLEQGLDAVRASYSGSGMYESGAAMKALNDYAAGMASGGLRDYFSLLGNQQAIGFNAALGQAGAGQTYANSITGANNNYAANAGNAYGNLGNAYSQGAINAGNINSQGIIANANNTNSMIQGVGSALGNAAGYFAYQPYAGGSMPTSGWGTPGIY